MGGLPIFAELTAVEFIGILASALTTGGLGAWAINAIKAWRAGRMEDKAQSFSQKQSEREKAFEEMLKVVDELRRDRARDREDREQDRKDIAELRRENRECNRREGWLKQELARNKIEIRPMPEDYIRRPPQSGEDEGGD